MKMRQDVNVIVYAADAVQVTLQIFVDAPHVSVEIIAAVLIDAASAPFGREDDVIQNLRVRVGHGRVLGVAANAAWGREAARTVALRASALRPRLLLLRR